MRGEQGCLLLMRPPSHVLPVAEVIQTEPQQFPSYFPGPVKLQNYQCSWRRKWQPTPVFLPGEFHGRRSLVGSSPWGSKESDMTAWLTHTHTHTQTHTHTSVLPTNTRGLALCPLCRIICQKLYSQSPPPGIRWAVWAQGHCSMAWNGTHIGRALRYLSLGKGDKAWNTWGIQSWKKSWKQHPFIAWLPVPSLAHFSPGLEFFNIFFFIITAVVSWS